jgi:pimeloyl-ACP methyl ester carboxylesterase
MSGFGELDLVNAMMERVDLDAGVPSAAVLRDVAIGDATLAIAEMPATGAEQGVALLIPGFTSSRGTFYPMFQMLADQGFRVISFSQRGQPGSTGGDSPADYPLATLGADVHKLADALGLTSGVHLLGHSFGGVVGIEAVVQNPSRFASYTMWNSGPSSLGDHLLEARAAVEAYGARALWVLDATEAGVDPEKDLRGELEGLEAYHYTRLMHTNPAQLQAGLSHLHEHRDRADELKSTGVPMLVSHGANDDAWPIADQREFAEKLGADYWVVANAGHSAHADRPATCAGLLATFWGTISTK